MSPPLCYGFMGPSSSPQGRHRRRGDDTGVKGVRRSEVEERGSQELVLALPESPLSRGRETDLTTIPPPPLTGGESCLPGGFEDQINQGLYKVSVNNQRRYTCLIHGVLPSHVNEIFLFKYVFLKWLN